MIMAGKSRSRKADSENKRGITRILDYFVIAVLGLAAIFITVGYFLPPEEQPPAREIPDGRSIKVQLFGGCGRGSEVMRLADRLREIGIDVVDIHKESGNLYPYSLVVDRRGNSAVAESLAHLLGLPEDRVVVQRYNLMVDATIVVGLDYTGLLAATER